MDPTLSSPLPCYCPLTSTVAEQAKAAELAKAEAEDALIDAQAAAEADAATAQAAQEAQEATHLRGLRVQLEADAAALEERALRAEGEKAAAQAEAGALREAAAAAQAADAAALKETAAAAAAALGAVQAEAAGAKLAEQAARGEGEDAKERCATLVSSNSKLQESVSELGAQLSEGRTRLSGLIKENAALQVPACTVHGCSVCSCLLSLPCLCAVTPAVCPAVYLQRAYRRERGAAGGADSRRRRRRRRRRRSGRRRWRRGRGGAEESEGGAEGGQEEVHQGLQNCGRRDQWAEGKGHFSTGAGGRDLQSGGDGIDRITGAGAGGESAGAGEGTLLLWSAVDHTLPYPLPCCGPLTSLLRWSRRASGCDLLRLRWRR